MKYKITLFLAFIIQVSGMPLESNARCKKAGSCPLDHLEVEQDFIKTGLDDNQIEFFFVKPPGEGPFPTIFIIHGSQFRTSSPGGEQLVSSGYLERFAKEGILSVAISSLGYGNSDGIRDFAGPNSQKAIIAVIDHFAKISFVDSSKMGIYGLSKGAILASMVHTQYPNFALQILEAGSYDLVSRSLELPEYLSGILGAMAREIGSSSVDALKERSAVYHTHNIHAKTLILHGEIDDRKGLSSAKYLHETLLSEGKNSLLKIFPGTPHRLPKEKWGIIIPFVREHFFGLYGIGVSLTQTIPAIQVSVIHSGSPADDSGKLRVGDAILRISQNNDDQEIIALNMPLQELVPLILGKKGTSLRLYVQHLDLSYEEVVIERG